MLLAAVYYDGWRPAAEPEKIRDRDQFLGKIRDSVSRGMPGMDAERVTRAVFGLLERHVSEGEIRQVISTLPEELRWLWPSVAAGRAENTAGAGTSGARGDTADAESEGRERAEEARSRV